MPRKLNFTWERDEFSTYILTFPNGHRRGANATEAALIEELARLRSDLHRVTFNACDCTCGRAA